MTSCDRAVEAAGALPLEELLSDLATMTVSRERKEVVPKSETETGR